MRLLFKDFYDDLVKDLDIPLIGSRVAGSITNQGYVEDSIVFGVLCGDFDVRVFYEAVDYQSPVKTAEKIMGWLGEVGLCLAYSANLIKDNVFIDHIFRLVQDSNPSLQITGGVSASPPTVFTSEGVYRQGIVCAAIAGLIITSQLVASHPQTGFMFELNAIAAAVLGGTSMAGGRGTIGGTIIGAFVISVLADGMVMMGVSTFWQQVIKGIVIIAAVVIDQFQRNLQSKAAVQED